LKKIPTLLKKIYENGEYKGISNEVDERFKWVLDGEGIATVKYDGSCCAIIDGKFYKRYDAKRGKKSPEGAIPCCEPDLETGHHPHWVLVDWDNPSDKWFVEAYETSIKLGDDLKDGTYEAIGKHFCGNPYGYNGDFLIRHGISVVTVDRTVDGIRAFVRDNDIEGLVFWKDGEPQCKIRKKDFGFKWK